MNNEGSTKLLQSLENVQMILQTNQNTLVSNLEATNRVASNIEVNHSNQQNYKNEKKGFFSSFFDKN
jgi:hypothetical protein